MSEEPTVYRVVYQPYMQPEEILGEYSAFSRKEAALKALLEHGIVDESEYSEKDIEAKIKFQTRTEYVAGFMDQTKVARCVECNTEFSEIEMEGAYACPSCGTVSVPAKIADDVEVKINWHELRILCMWAENWAKHLQDTDQDQSNTGALLTIMSIAGRLQNQHPDKKDPLTLFSEIRKLRKDNPDMEIETDIDDDGRIA